jgi:SAM-dependent methyltransferase
MASYVGRHAELYDVLYAEKDYAGEAAFVHQCIQRNAAGPARRILELACGTGSHALALEKLGYEIIATDYSQDMLQNAQAKAKSAFSEVQFQRQDMTALQVAGPPFDAAICLFDSIGYVATNEALKQVLTGIHGHLKQDGLFIFEFWHAAAMIRAYDPVRVRRWSMGDGEVLRISESRMDYARQLCHVTYTIYELRSDGTFTQLKETQTNRYFLIQEMACFLADCGFVPIKWYEGFTDKESIDENSWHVVAVTRKRSVT